MGLRARLVMFLCLTLTLVLGGVAGFILWRVDHIVTTEAQDSAGLLAEAIADSIQAFGEAGEMGGLERFLDNLKQRPDLGPVHAVRARGTVVDFGERAGAAPTDQWEETVIRTGEPLRQIDPERHQIRYIFPLKNRSDCRECHPNAAENEVLGLASVTTLTERADRAETQLFQAVGGTILVALILAGAFMTLYLSCRLVRPVDAIAHELRERASHLAENAGEVAAASCALHNQADRQQASMEEAGQALENMSSLTRTTAEHARQAGSYLHSSAETTTRAEQAMSSLTTSMETLVKASEETGRIVKTIDEVAFQTNLLALNAAVEAARAGEAGAGFAVVAEEVRNLAGRAAEAAKTTGEQIEAMTRRIRDGSKVLQETNGAFRKVADNARGMQNLIDGIGRGTEEQAEGIARVSQIMSGAREIATGTATQSEQTAGAAASMQQHVGRTRQEVNRLVAMINPRQNLDDPTQIVPPACQGIRRFEESATAPAAVR